MHLFNKLKIPSRDTNPFGLCQEHMEACFCYWEEGCQHFETLAGYSDLALYSGSNKLLQEGHQIKQVQLPAAASPL